MKQVQGCKCDAICGRLVLVIRGGLPPGELLVIWFNVPQRKYPSAYASSPPACRYMSDFEMMCRGQLRQYPLHFVFDYDPHARVSLAEALRCPTCSGLMRRVLDVEWDLVRTRIPT